MQARILWLTNLPVPYRWIIWRGLADLAKLDVVCLAAGQSNKSWSETPRVGRAALIILGQRGLGIAGDRIYFPGLRLLRIVRRDYQAVFIDGWESPAYWLALLASKILRRRVLVGFRSTANSQRYKRGLVRVLRSTFLKAADGVVVSGVDSLAAAGALGVEPSRLFTIANITDSYLIERTVWERRGLSTPQGSDTFRALFVGQLIDRKNPAMVLKAWLRSAGIRDELHFAGSGPMERVLRNLAHDSGRSANVYFHGHLEFDDLASLYASSHCFLLPSSREVWGLAANEALTAGLHVIVSDLCGIAPEIQGLPGVTISPVDEGAISQHLIDARRGWNGWWGSERINSLGWEPNEVARQFYRALTQ